MESGVSFSCSGRFTNIIRRSVHESFKRGIMKKFFVAVLAAFSLAIVPAAQAHYPAVTGTSSWAKSLVYNQWNNKCGDRFWWRCEHRQSELSASKYGDGHSWNVSYCWVDQHIVTQRWEQWCLRELVTHGNLGAMLRYPYVNRKG